MKKNENMELGIGNIHLLSDEASRSISAENFKGEKGKGAMATEGVSKECARDLGRGWKISPCIRIEPGETAVLMETGGPGIIRHLWITLDNKFYRDIVLRVYWDGEKTPSVEAPVGDFFCNGFCTRCNILAMPINVNPSGGFNSYFPMPFGKHAKITVENQSPEKLAHFFYTINFGLCEVPENAARFHARWRRTNPLPYKEDYLIIDGIKGKGHYVGTYMAWQQNNYGWWGEGEIKMFLDGDTEFPTICGTGTEDYFGGAWGFGETFSAPYLGYPLRIGEEGKLGRHGLYRFHILDPIRFEKDFKATMQAIGWRSGGRYLPLQDDISSTAYWYQTEPHNPFPELPDRDYREVI